MTLYDPDRQPDLPPIPPQLRGHITLLLEAAQLWQLSFMASFHGVPPKETVGFQASRLLLAEHVMDRWRRHLRVPHASLPDSLADWLDDDIPDLSSEAG